MRIDGVKIPGLKQDLKQLQQTPASEPAPAPAPSDGLAGSVEPSGLMPSSLPTTAPAPVDPQAAPNASGATSYPARIVILRHGEKPDDDDTNPNQDPAGLTPQGEARAQALANVLPQDYPHIDYIFAAANSKNSHRPVDTITPLAQKLGLPVDTDFKNKDFASLASTLEHDPQYAGKTIMIDWHHGEIPALTQALGATPPETAWPGNEFDRMWQIDFSKTGQATVSNLPEKALPTDSQT